MGRHQESNLQMAHLGDIQQELLSSSLLSGSWKRQQSTHHQCLLRDVYCDHAKLMTGWDLKSKINLPFLFNLIKQYYFGFYS